MTDDTKAPPKWIPYIGEIVHVHEFPRGTHPGPRAAIVAFVWPDDGSVNLAVLDPHGSVTAASAVTVIQSDGPVPQKQSYVTRITDEDKETKEVSGETNANIEQNIGTNKPNPYQKP